MRFWSPESGRQITSERTNDSMEGDEEDDQNVC